MVFVCFMPDSTDGWHGAGGKPAVSVVFGFGLCGNRVKTS